MNPQTAPNNNPGAVIVYPGQIAERVSTITVPFPKLEVIKPRANNRIAKVIPLASANACKFSLGDFFESNLFSFFIFFFFTILPPD